MGLGAHLAIVSGPLLVAVSQHGLAIAVAGVALSIGICRRRGRGEEGRQRPKRTE